MMRNYYYLVASLPELLMDQERKDFSVNALRKEVKENVHPSDYKLLELLFLPYDNENFLNKLLKRGLSTNDLGTISPSIYDDFEGNFSQLPQYMQDFYLIHTKKDKTADSNNEDEAQESDKPVEVLFQEAFYKMAMACDSSFLKKWFAFGRDFNNILTAINCRRLGIDPAKQLVGEGFIVDALAHSQAADFGLKQEVDYIDRIIQITDIQDVMERERKFDLLKWNMATELTTWDYFNINFVLAFFIKASIMQRWASLDTKLGAKMFDQLFSDLKASFNVEDAFKPEK